MYYLIFFIEKFTYNLLFGVLLEIWHGSKMYEFKKMHTEIRRQENHACKNCDIFSIYQLDKSLEIQRMSNLDELAKNDVKKLLLKP